MIAKYLSGGVVMPASDEATAAGCGIRYRWARPPPVRPIILKNGPDANLVLVMRGVGSGNA